MKIVLPLACAVVFLGSVRPACAAPATVPADQARCFQIQFLLRLTNLESGHFVRQVADLRELAPDDPAVPARVHILSLQAAALRLQEAGNFSRVAQLFRAAGAPPALRTWAAAEAGLLKGPAPLTPDERKMAATQPDIADVLATLDECDRVKTDTDTHGPLLGEWIGLTGHAAGVWAADVGEVAAALCIGLADQAPVRLEDTLGARLAATAPVGTPAAVTHALGLLSPPMGNLGGLEPPVATDIPVPQASAASQSLLDAFSAQSLIPISP